MLAKKNKTGDYRHLIGYKRLIIAFLLVAVVLMALIALCLGSSGLTLSRILQIIMGNGTKQENAILYKIRLPRIVTAIVVGGLLAVSGCVMQNILRNPLASASTLGVSQGASFGATIGIIVFGAGVQKSVSSSSAIVIYHPSIVVISAFVGGIISAVIILLLSRYKHMGAGSMVLAGVALSALFSGGTTIIQYFADDVQVAAVVFWTFGDLGRTSWKEIGMLAVAFVVCFIYFMVNRWNYNALESGLNTAKSLGVNIDIVTVVSMLVASFAASIAVAFIGIISFVGLIAPHIIRRFIGNDHRFLIPASAVMGALLLLVSDTFGRLIIAPVILPIGAITSFLGAPMFLYLLFKGVDGYDRG